MADDNKLPEETQDPLDETPQEPAASEETQDLDAVSKLLEKKGFSSSEDLVRSYEELERYKSRLESDNASLRRSAGQVIQSRVPQSPQESDEDFLKRLASSPRATLKQFYSEMTHDSQIEQALDWVAQQEDYTPSMDARLAEIVAENHLTTIPPLKAARLAMAAYRDEIRAEQAAENGTPQKPAMGKPAEVKSEESKRTEKVRASATPKKATGGGEVDISKLSAADFKKTFDIPEAE